MDSIGFKTPVEDRYFEDYVPGSVHEFSLVTIEEEGKGIVLSHTSREEPCQFVSV